MIMQSKKQLSTIVHLYVIAIIIIIAFIYLFADFFTEQIEFSRKAKIIRDYHYQYHRDAIKHEVESVYNFIVKQQDKITDIAQKSAKRDVEEAFSIAENIYNTYKNKKNDKEIKQLIVDVLRPIRHNDGKGYYFITGTDGVEVLMSDRPELEGTDMRDVQDPDGKYVVQDMIDLAAEKGEGFYSYKWTKPGVDDNTHEKVSFIKLFKPYNWIIGTGVYVDDYETGLKNEILEEIGKIRFGENDSGYVFVISYDGITLMNDYQRNLIGQNTWGLEDVNGLKLFQEQRKAVENPDGDFIKYIWQNPNTNKISEKISFMKGFPEWQWMIGAGFYVDNVDPVIEDMHDELYDELRQEIYEYLVIIVLITVLFLFVTRLLIKRITKDFNALVMFFKKATVSDSLFDRSKIRFAEFDEIAECADKMLAERIKTQKELDELNKSLNSRVAEEVRKNEYQERLIFQQKKFADMGQMISAIAHQWRQPLNNIHLINQMLKDIDKGVGIDISKDDLYKQHQEIVLHMSKTIDDFRNYFSVKKKKEKIKIYDELKNTVNLISAQLRAHNIKVNMRCADGETGRTCCDKDENCCADEYYCLAGELRQIVLNILSNAKDAIVEKNKTHVDETELIDVSLEVYKEYFNIKISNTGSQIDEDVLARIFDPYFTTKEEGKGTGIGLYMTKCILERDMAGSISVENTETGVSFSIILRKQTDGKQQS